MKHLASPFQLNTGEILYCFFPPQTIYIWATTFFFYDSGVEYQVTHFCCFLQYLRSSSDCKRSSIRVHMIVLVNLLLCIQPFIYMYAGTAKPKNLIWGRIDQIYDYVFVFTKDGIGLSFSNEITTPLSTSPPSSSLPDISMVSLVNQIGRAHV